MLSVPVCLMSLLLFSVLLLLFPVLIRTMLEQGTRTLSPTMLMETYESVSPLIGNLLNTIIIISGFAGMVLLKYVLYPRFIKDEVKGMLLLFAAALPFAVALRYVGKASVLVIMIALCGISIVIGALNLLMSYYNTRFIKYGKNATAAGITNAAASFGVMAESYGFLYVADKYGWNTVTSSWTGMVIVATLLTAAAIPCYIKFKKM